LQGLCATNGEGQCVISSGVTTTNTHGYDW
jgi:hypothetical protein